MTKTGDIAGPRVLEHIVDVVLYLEVGTLLILLFYPSILYTSNQIWLETWSTVFNNFVGQFIPIMYKLDIRNTNYSYIGLILLLFVL